MRNRAERAGSGGLRGALVVLAVVAAFAGGARAQVPGAKPACEPGLGEAMARKIQARYEAVRDLQADFVQTSTAATFEGEALMSAAPRQGKVVFAKPGKMRWTYAAPEASVVVSDGRTLWIHDLDAKTVTRLAVTEGYLSGAALQFLLGDGKILEAFEVGVAECDAKQVTLDLLPREDASYERLGLVADRATGSIRATSVTDLFGNQTNIRFERLEENRNPAPKTFVFEIPAGVELIDYEASGRR